MEINPIDVKLIGFFFLLSEYVLTSYSVFIQIGYFLLSTYAITMRMQKLIIPKKLNKILLERDNIMVIFS